MLQARRASLQSLPSIQSIHSLQSGLTSVNSPNLDQDISLPDLIDKHLSP